MRYVNDAGDVLELTGLEARRATLTLTLAAPMESIVYRRYEYWERLRAVADFETWVLFAEANRAKVEEEKVEEEEAA